jgi:hypothetical protein
MLLVKLAARMAAGLALAAVITSCGHGPARSPAGPRGGRPECPAGPSSCGFPGAVSTGVPAGTALKAVPGQLSGGSGWHYDARDRQVDVTGSGAVLSGLSIRGSLNISAGRVTIRDDRIVTGGPYGISLRHTARVMIEDSTITGRNATSGRVNVAIGDLYGDSTRTVIARDNLSAFRTGVSISTGLITGNYLHDPGYLAGDHTNGVLAGGTKPLTISHNTILNDRGQTDAISIDTSTGTVVANKTIRDNLLAGGGYPLYGGASLGHATANIRIEDNRFAQAYYRAGGRYGPVAYFDAGGTGNTWTGNTWAASGRAIPAPGRPAAGRAGPP